MRCVRNSSRTKQKADHNIFSVSLAAKKDASFSLVDDPVWLEHPAVFC